jgi:hypothetical protein
MRRAKRDGVKESSPSPSSEADTSSLIPMRASLTEAYSQFLSEPTPGGLLEIQQHAIALANEVERIYGKASKESRSFAQHLVKLLMPVMAIAKNRVMSKKQEAQIVARIKEIDGEIERLTQENRGIRERAQRETDRVRGQAHENVAAIHESVDQTVSGISAELQFVSSVIAMEQDRIRGITAAMAEARAASAARVLQESEKSLPDDEHRLKSPGQDGVI